MDDFFTNSDKPFAENLNDSVLLANALEFKVLVSAPTMFSTGGFIDTTVARKCGVCTMRLSESLPTGVSVTGDGYLSFTGAKSISFFVYPNFNQFGKWDKLDWTSKNNRISIDLLTKTGDVIESNISKDTTLSDNVELKKLDEIIVRVNSTGNDVLQELSFVFTKKNNVTVDESSVRLIGYSTTEEVTRLIHEITHEILKDIFVGKVEQVTVLEDTGKLVVGRYTEEDL